MSANPLPLFPQTPKSNLNGDAQVRLLFGIARDVAAARYSQDIEPINRGRYPGPQQELGDAYRIVIQDLSDLASHGLEDAE